MARRDRQKAKYIKREVEKSLSYRRILEKQKDPSWKETQAWRDEVERYTMERIDHWEERGMFK